MKSTLLCVSATALFSAAFALAAPPRQSEVQPTRVTILHTNDLHSHFRAERTELGLGGVARLKTAVDRVRKENANSLLLDGGDWSEGNIFYNLGAGTETLRMMDHLGYDVAVVGNHDWLNGPDVLYQAWERAAPRMQLVAANIDLSAYERARDFRRAIPPYVIREVGGFKIAVIGLVTYEFIYDGWLAPIKIEAPFAITRELAERLKKTVDAVIVISHNSLKLNREILRVAPAVDLVIGAHDHQKVTKEIVIERAGGQPGWLVETGSWGRYLGRVDMDLLPKQVAAGRHVPALKLAHYKLQQMDFTVPEHRPTLERIERLERELEGDMGPIFHDHVAENHVEFNRHGQENLIGNLAADSYLAATQADLALDQVNFIYNELHHGDLASVDVFNANPAIFNPNTGKSWTIRVIPIRGRTLSWLLNVLYSSKQLAQNGILSAAGMRVTYDPLLVGNRSIRTIDGTQSVLLQALTFIGDTNTIIRDVTVHGQKLDPSATYKVAAGGGIYHAIRIMNSFLPNAIPLDGMVDTGIEDWRSMVDRLRALSPVTIDKVRPGGRVMSVQPDLGVVHDEVEWTKLGMTADGKLRARVKVTVRNYGVAPSFNGTAVVKLLGNRNLIDTSIDPDFVEIGEPWPIRMLPSLETETYEWNVEVPGAHGLFPLTVAIEGAQGEVNQTNDTVTRWLKP